MGVALPVILWDEGFTFSSAKFHHGKEVAESDGKYYAINHHDGKVYRTDATGTITENEETVFLQTFTNRFFNYKTVVSILIAALLMVLLFSSLNHMRKTAELQKGAYL
jgi:F-type H+-transporting ATPase subunit a